MVTHDHTECAQEPDISVGVAAEVHELKEHKCMKEKWERKTWRSLKKIRTILV